MFCGALLLAGAACVAASEASYELQAGDVISVAVYQEENLSREVLIRPDGGMSYPLVGDIQAAGRSPLELKTELEASLSEFIPDASVTVSVLQSNGNRVFVLGKVGKPGAYPIFRPLDVMQALALAGGTTQFASTDDIRILRRLPDGAQQVIDFRYSRVLNGRDLEQNIVLESGDTIVVP